MHSTRRLARSPRTELRPPIPPSRKGGVIEQRRLTAQAVLDILRRRCAQAGVPRLAPHDLRRTVASGLLDRGADLGTVSRILGHVSADVTLGYDRRPEQVKRAAGCCTCHTSRPADPERERDPRG